MTTKLPPAPNTAYLLLGANLGDRDAALATARDHLRRHGELLAVSSVYETAPWGGAGVADQPPYRNQAVALHTLLDPFALLRLAKQIESALGRDFAAPRWAARPIDVDILLFGRFEIEFGDDLMLPHPRLTGRRFALTPLADIAPAILVAGTSRTVAELLAICPDPLPVERVGE